MWANPTNLTHHPQLNFQSTNTKRNPPLSPNPQMATGPAELLKIKPSKHSRFFARFSPLGHKSHILLPLVPGAARHHSGRNRIESPIRPPVKNPAPARQSDRRRRSPIRLVLRIASSRRTAASKRHIHRRPLAANPRQPLRHRPSSIHLPRRRAARIFCPPPCRQRPHSDHRDHRGKHYEHAVEAMKRGAHDYLTKPFAKSDRSRRRGEARDRRQRPGRVAHRLRTRSSSTSCGGG